ncbi:hypothetical protein D3C85_1650350 [compost metagenome]
MAMLRRFTRAQYRRKANIRAFKQLAPVLAWLAGKNPGKRSTQFFPAVHVPLFGETRVFRKAQLLQQQRVELRLH